MERKFAGSSGGRTNKEGNRFAESLDKISFRATLRPIPFFMNQKQLANVLIKVLGLSFCVDGVVRVISGVLSLFALLTSRNNFGSGYSSYYWTTPVTGAALGLIGILFVFLSKPIAEALFKDE